MMYKEMYKDLKMQLQDYAAGTMRDDDAEVAFDALNAIEKLEHKVFILEGDREGLLAQIPRWIPVSEKLPKADERDARGFAVPYLVMNGWMRVTARRTKDYWVLFGHGTVLEYVTHWMPLPEPPEED